MPKNDIRQLREHLFETLEQLKDREKPMEIERAKAISEVAQTIINSAKVEVQYLAAIGQDGAASEFLRPGDTNGRVLPDSRKGLSTGKNLGSPVA